MLRKIILLFIIVGLSNNFAQSYNPNISSTGQSSNIVKDEQNQLNILAVMVEFQKDDFSLTYGDGTFGSIYSEDQDYGNNIIDPLPHNKNYFEDHLEFAQNYYNKVSDGIVNIDYTVLPNIVTVSKPMREYSPTQGEDFTLLENFSEEVWGLVNTSNQSFDFSQYNVFIIFHAGAGKDISTSDLFGEARDLPSIYLGINTLKELKGESFNGYQMNDGTLITNSVILPETESREESGIGGTALIELSINGLIVSSLASHMGLPDLFDAETGKSAIGRFGLMDGQSLFAYAGLFPPEPSAWEKIFLGWEEPVIIDSEANNIQVVARQIANSTDIKIAKVPINSTEYYLIENRSRDANDDGANITYKVNGQIRTIKFDEDLDNFNNAIVDTLQGVVIDVDEFDWAVPGNGILIWHIDEKIITAGLADNKINVGENRGVDLEEADGIQDIGEEFTSIFGDLIIAEGDEKDYWFSSNDSELYENVFGSVSKPNTNSNSGSKSLITITNFSDLSPRMSFDLSFSTNNISLINKFVVHPNLAASNFKLNSNNDEVSGYFSSGNNLYRVDSVIRFVNGISFNNYATINNESGEIIFGAVDNQITVGIYDGSEISTQLFTVVGKITAPIVIDNNASDVGIYVGFEDGTIRKYSYNIANNQFNETPVLEVKLFDSMIKQIAFYNNVIVGISENQFSDLESAVEFQASIKKMLFTKDITGSDLSIFLTDDNSIHTFIRGENSSTEIYSCENNIESIALADIKNDGENYIVFTESSEISAINIVGSFAENFPIELDVDTEFKGTPLIADINSDNYGDVVVTSSQGDVFAFSGESGAILNGFPISVGGSFAGNHAIIKRENDLLLSVGTSENDFYFWSINSNGEVLWGSELGNNMNSSSLTNAKDANYVNEYFPKNRTYNWPNPTYGSETFIRTYVSEDSQVKVTIFDLAGDLVDEFEFPANGGVDVESAWDVSAIQSGAYFAHVEVKSNSGKTESKIIKIAVVK